MYACMYTHTHTYTYTLSVEVQGGHKMVLNPLKLELYTLVSCLISSSRPLEEVWVHLSSLRKSLFLRSLWKVF